MAGAWCQVLGVEDRADMRRALLRLLASERTARDRLGGDVVAAFERSDTGGLIVSWRRDRPAAILGSSPGSTRGPGTEDSGPGLVAA